MSQSKKKSLMETATQVGTKFCTATLLWMWLRPMAMNINPLIVTAIFSAHSFVMGYVIRRIWNLGEQNEQ